MSDTPTPPPPPVEIEIPPPGFPLPYELILNIYQNLDPRSANNLRATSRFHNKIFVENRNKMQKAEMNLDLILNKTVIRVITKAKNVNVDLCAFINPSDQAKPRFETDYDLYKLKQSTDKYDRQEFYSEDIFAALETVLESMLFHRNVNSIFIQGNLNDEILDILNYTLNEGSKKQIFINETKIRLTNIAKWERFIIGNSPQVLKFIECTVFSRVLLTDDIIQFGLRNLTKFQVCDTQSPVAKLNLSPVLRLPKLSTIIVDEKLSFTGNEVIRKLKKWLTAEEDLKLMDLRFAKEDHKLVVEFLNRLQSVGLEAARKEGDEELESEEDEDIPSSFGFPVMKMWNILGANDSKKQIVIRGGFTILVDDYWSEFEQDATDDGSSVDSDSDDSDIGFHDF